MNALITIRHQRCIMPETGKETDTSTKSTMLSGAFSPLGEFATRQCGAVAEVQKELIGQIVDQLQQANAHWLESVKSETDFVSDMVSKLANARSAPEATAVWQEWANHRLQTIIEDWNRSFSGISKLIEKNSQVFHKSNGGQAS